MQWQVIVGVFITAQVLAAQTVHLKTRTFEGSAVQGTRPVAHKHWRANRSHYLLQFRTPVNDEIRAELEARGAEVTAMVPDNAVVVAAGRDFSAEGLDVVFSEEPRREDKISLLAGIHGNELAYLVEFYEDVDPQAARALLRSEGLTVVEHPDLLSVDVLVTGTLEDVEKLRDWDEVAYIFPAPAEMLDGERFQNCTGALSSGAVVAQYVRMGYGWSVDASGIARVGYAFGALTPKVPDQIAKDEVIRAMSEWSKVARVQFVPSTLTAAKTIAVKFATGDHGDGFPFDGPNLSLAHTFYPANPEPAAGDMHLDGDEAWHAGTNIDVYTVALHELGHALGLGHSDQPGAIMYPYYRFPAEIGLDDIAGIQSIYGAPLGSSAAPLAPPLNITVLSPWTGAIPVNMSSVNIAGTTANGSGPVSVAWQTDRSASGIARGTTAWIASGIPTPPGTTTVTFTATDELRRTATKSLTLIRASASAQDTTPPVLSVIDPRQTVFQTSQPNITLSGIASDNVDVVRVSWQNGGYGSGTATGTKMWTAAAIPLLVGTNTVIVRAYDAAGNSSWRTVNVVRR